jgi:hypothetical protein
MIKRILVLVLGSLVLTLLLTTVAVAGWTPQDIYNDFATHGELTQNYTDAQLQAYLNDATLAQYANQDIKKRLDELVYDRVGRKTFPFTGFQLMIAGIVVVALIGGGIVLRRLSRPDKSSQKS